MSARRKEKKYWEGTFLLSLSTSSVKHTFSSTWMPLLRAVKIANLAAKEAWKYKSYVAQSYTQESLGRSIAEAKGKNM